MPIRVLQIVTAMNKGGLETMIMNYYRHIDKNRVQFDFLVHGNARGDYDTEIENLGGKIYHLPRLNPFSANYRHSLVRFFKENSYDIVHCHLDCMSALPLKAAKAAGIPVRIAHTHTSGEDKNLKFIIKSVYKRQIKRYANHLFACGQAAGRFTFLTDDFTVIPNAVDTAKFCPDSEIRDAVRRELSVAERKVIGHVGGFRKVKNHTFLLDAFGEINKRDPDTVLLLVGDGKTRAFTEKKAAEMGLSNCVIFTGIRDDTERYFKAMDIFVLPSLHEGLPLVMIEAQYTGLPCIISDKVPDECIITAGSVTSMELSAGKEKWAEHILDRLNEEKSEIRFTKKAESFDIEKAAVRLTEFYESANS